MRSAARHRWRAAEAAHVQRQEQIEAKHRGTDKRAQDGEERDRLKEPPRQSPRCGIDPKPVPGREARQVGLPIQISPRSLRIGMQPLTWRRMNSGFVERWLEPVTVQKRHPAQAAAKHQCVRDAVQQTAWCPPAHGLCVGDRPGTGGPACSRRSRRWPRFGRSPGSPPRSPARPTPPSSAHQM